MNTSVLPQRTGILILVLQLLLIFVFVTGDGNYFTKANDVTDDTPYLSIEEVVYVIETVDEKEIEVALPVQKVLFEYVEVMDGCGPHFEGECLRVRGGPGTDFPVVSRLRNGMVLKISGKVQRHDTLWYKVIFDEWIRYPERITSDWYVASDYVRVLLDEGDKIIKSGETVTSNKKIVVNRSKQELTAYDGDTVYMTATISTGLELSPTPLGTFKVYKKTPSRYMQGPLPYISNSDYYDLPGVPWNLYFTEGGAVIHGAYWHDSFGTPYSHGCVNLPPKTARKLYTWAELGTTVYVKN